MTASSSATESTTQPDIGRVAATIGDPTRIRMLLLLMEGRSPVSYTHLTLPTILLV